MYSYGYIVSVSKPNAFVLARNAPSPEPKNQTKPKKLK